MKKRILSLFLVACTVMTLALPAVQVRANNGNGKGDQPEYSINAKKDIPDIFSIN